VTSAAVVIGIDEYATQPLTSAVNDACAMRDALVRLGLVGPDDVVLLTAPSEAGAGAPTRKAILGALYPFYNGTRQVDRLFVCYSGHGLMAYADNARTQARTALVPVDVTNLDSDGDLLIDLESVLAHFRLAGPLEQFFFVDACRDLAYEQHPAMTSSLGWTAIPPGPERAQATVYAVPLLGQARGESGGRGVMTQQGIALDYSDDLRAYVVSPESVAAYAKKRVLEQVGTVPLWQRKYILPTLDHPEPKTRPIRVLEAPPDAALTVRVEPVAAVPDTEVKLSQLDQPVCAWPPNALGEPWPVKPRRYWLDTTSAAGEPDPAHLQLDVREQQEATIRIRVPGLETLVPRVQPEPGPSPPEVRTTPGVVEGGMAQIGVVAKEPQSMVELEQLDPPYGHWSQPHELRQKVAPGAYRVQVRLGPDLYSQAELQVGPGDNVEVTPTFGSSPLLQDLLQGREPAAEAVVSESIGPIQAAVLPTVLPILGIKPFDRTGELLEQFQNVVPQYDPATFGMRPLSLVLAIDGNDWPESVARVVRSTSAVIEASPTEPVPIALLPDEFAGGRIGLAVVRAPARSFLLRVESTYFGSIALAAASLEGRVTVVTLTVRPDGSFDISQNLLRVPGLKYREPVLHVPYGRMVRQLQLGQKLYASGELFEHSRSAGELMELFYAKWTDPILSCMAYYSWIDAIAAGQVSKDTRLGGIVAHNLNKYFSDLADARIVFALERKPGGASMLSDLIAADELPVLARSAAELERVTQGRTGGRLGSFAGRVVPGQPWLMSWSAGAAAATARQLTATT
jgi:hypothetical protein